MTLSVLSRYTYETDTNGYRISVRKDINDVLVQKYTVKLKDTVETIATSIYGDPRQWWRIADINPQIKFPLDLQPGMVIRIPQ